MSNKTIYQVVTVIRYEGLSVTPHWKAFNSPEAADEYADALIDKEGLGTWADEYYDYVRIVKTELE